MNDELFLRIQQLQRIAGVMRGLMHEAQATAPAGVRATDVTGAVTIVLDAEGFPLKITVAGDWRQRLGTRALGPAVMDAGGKAALSRMKAWTQALQEGVWARKVERMITTGPDPLAAEVPELLRRKSEPRPIGDLCDEMVKALDGVAPPLPQPSRFRGVSRRHHVAITLDAGGMTGCRVDGSWAARQSGAALSTALAEALAAAKAEVRAANRDESDRPDQARAADNLLDEVISLIQNPDRLANP